MNMKRMFIYKCLCLPHQISINTIDSLFFRLTMPEMVIPTRLHTCQHKKKALLLSKKLICIIYNPLFSKIIQFKLPCVAFKRSINPII